MAPYNNSSPTGTAVDRFTLAADLRNLKIPDPVRYDTAKCKSLVAISRKYQTQKHCVVVNMLKNFGVIPTALVPLQYHCSFFISHFRACTPVRPPPEVREKFYPAKFGLNYHAKIVLRNVSFPSKCHRLLVQPPIMTFRFVSHMTCSSSAVDSCRIKAPRLFCRPPLLLPRPLFPLLPPQLLLPCRPRPPPPPRPPEVRFRGPAHPDPLPVAGT